jgi:hypothetical protein
VTGGANSGARLSLRAAFEIWKPVRAVARLLVPGSTISLSSSTPAGLASIAVRRHLWDVTYRADQYLEVIDTYSGNRVLDPAIWTGLFERIGVRIEARPSQEVRKTCRATLTAGKSQAPT